MSRHKGRADVFRDQMNTFGVFWVRVVVDLLILPSLIVRIGNPAFDRVLVVGHAPLATAVNWK
eukprot:7248682-Prorocentrum_lima.AAC.1